jgi:hypothetical protein
VPGYDLFGDQAVDSRRWKCLPSEAWKCESIDHCPHLRFGCDLRGNPFPSHPTELHFGGHTLSSREGLPSPRKEVGDLPSFLPSFLCSFSASPLRFFVPFYFASLDILSLIFTFLILSTLPFFLSFLSIVLSFLLRHFDLLSFPSFLLSLLSPFLPSIFSTYLPTYLPFLRFTFFFHRYVFPLFFLPSFPPSSPSFPF